MILPNRAEAILAGAVLWVGLAGAAWGQTAPATSPAPVPKPAAVVNGEPIALAEVEAVIKAFGPSPVELTQEKRRQMRLQAVGMLVDDLLLKQYLRQHVPAASPEEVNKKLVELEQGLKKQGKSLADFYRETGQTEAQLRADVATQVQWLAFVQPRLNESDLRRYYDGYKEFFDNVTVRASHIVLRVPAEASPADRQAAQLKLQNLRKEIAAGLDFAEAARKHSQCPSAPAGGDLGYFPRKWMVEENFARAAFALKIGDISDVVQTDFGYHLIKTTDRKPGEPSSYEKIKDEVREVYLEDLRQSMLTQLRKAAKIEVNVQ